MINQLVTKEDLYKFRLSSKPKTKFTKVTVEQAEKLKVRRRIEELTDKPFAEVWN